MAFSIKFALLTPPYCFLLFLNFSEIFVNALNIGTQSTDPNAPKPPERECSRICESEYCSVPPLLRYGKYCGVLYSGCPGEIPCDGIDQCCMNHDNCITDKNNDYLNKECSQQLLKCVEDLEKSNVATFPNSKCEAGEVIKVIKNVMQAALLANGLGIAFHPPLPAPLPPP